MDLSLKRLKTQCHATKNQLTRQIPRITVTTSAGWFQYPVDNWPQWNCSGFHSWWALKRFRILSLQAPYRCTYTDTHTHTYAHTWCIHLHLQKQAHIHSYRHKCMHSNIADKLVIFQCGVDVLVIQTWDPRHVFWYQLVIWHMNV